MKKKICFFSIIVITVIGIIALLVFSGKKEYDVDKIISLISTNITNNMCLKSETIVEENLDNFMNARTETYIKDNKISIKYYMGTEYEKEINKLIQESFIDTKEKTQTNIIHYAKQILNAEYNEFYKNSISEQINYYKEDLDLSKNTYKYCGKENGIIKVSIFTNNFEAGEQKEYLYINEKEKLLEKVEVYSINEESEELYSTTTFSYSYDSVKDEDVNFDITKYSDYIVADKEF